MRRTLVRFVAAAAVLLGFAPAVRADVQLTLHNGLVTLNATNATVRQILEQWARVGQTRIVNVERIVGAPVTMQLVDMPEGEALEIILRSVSGYLAAPRPVDVPNLSRFDRILVLPTSTPRNDTRSSTPTFQQPQFVPPTPSGDPDDDLDEPAPSQVVPNPRGPIFNTFPQPGPPQRPEVDAAPPAAAPGRPFMFGGAAPGVPQTTAPVGVAVPGMVVPQPQQPGGVPQGQVPPGGRDDP